MKYNTLFFDLDGTLIDSFPGVTKGLIYAFQTMGFPIPDNKSLRKFIGPPLQESIPLYMGFDKEQTKEAIRLFKKTYENGGMFDLNLIDGVEKALQHFRNQGRKMYVITSKDQKPAIAILEKMGLSKYFDGIYGSSYEEDRITKTDVLNFALKKLNLSDLDSILMIGDTRFDVEGANNVGIASLGLLSGFGSEEELLNEGVTYIVSDFNELIQLEL
jgi:phosphoglycolate phosphatase